MKHRIRSLDTLQKVLHKDCYRLYEKIMKTYHPVSKDYLGQKRFMEVATQIHAGWYYYEKQ